MKLSKKKRNDILKSLIDELREIESLENNTDFAKENLKQARKHIRKVIYEEAKTNLKMVRKKLRKKFYNKKKQTSYYN
jgi:ElaB/YqjD/DUF883 family membrane-anchored ribosome-binding protein